PGAERGRDLGGREREGERRGAHRPKAKAERPDARGRRGDRKRDAGARREQRKKGSRRLGVVSPVPRGHDDDVDDLADDASASLGL
ncbi:MAG: hypothetical protein M3N16_03435, partial [Actinomycetota bacterium]|nr:hypothetical protein [Actinomycetota bacterium]